MKDFDFSYITPGTLMGYNAPSLQPNAMKFEVEASLKHSLRKMLHQRDQIIFCTVLKRPNVIYV
jgi:hypothetical protein